MAETCRQVFREIGLNPDRMALEWASAAEGPRFVELITKYVARIRSLGPLGGFEGEVPKDVLERRLEAALKAAETPKVRTAYGNVAKKLHETRDVSVYAPERISQEVSERILPTFRQELLNNDIILCLADMRGQEKKNLSSQELMAMTGASSEELEKVLSALGKKGVIQGGPDAWILAEKGA